MMIVQASIYVIKIGKVRLQGEHKWYNNYILDVFVF